MYKLIPGEEAMIVRSLKRHSAQKRAEAARRQGRAHADYRWRLNEEARLAESLIRKIERAENIGLIPPLYPKEEQ